MAIGLFNVLVGLLFGQIKSLWQVVIFITPFLGFYIVYLLTRPSEDTVLIPENFQGTAYIYYDQRNGIPQEYEHGRRVYRVPADGIVLTQSSLKEGVIDLNGTEYFIEDATHHRRRLHQSGSITEVTDTGIVQVIYGDCGISQSYGIYQTIYVGYPSRVLYDHNAASERMHDSIMHLRLGR